MTLTKEQIDYLFDFCKRHYVRSYEVQVELVDHLASAIEDKVSVHPDLSFDKALEQVYAGFGTTGFRDYQKNQLERIREQNLKNFKLYTKSSLFLQNIGYGILLGMVVYTLMVLFTKGSNVIFPLIWFSLSVFLCLLIFRYLYQLQKTTLVPIQSTRRLWITALGSTFVYFMTPFYGSMEFSNYPLIVSILSAVYLFALLVLKDRFRAYFDRLETSYPEVFRVYQA